MAHPNPGEVLNQLCNIMTRLRSPEGCSWDRAQTLDSLRKYLLEETYEVLDAIDTAEHCEELGDLLLQIVFQSEVAREQGAFEMADVCQAICDKLIRRHPHIFGSESADGAAGTNPHWERIKKEERQKKGVEHKSALDGVPKALPALAHAEQISKRAAKTGFDWPDISGVWEKFDEETDELKEAIQEKDERAIAHELGDVFFSIVNLARHLGIDAELALHDANKRFETRFKKVEQSLARDNLEMKKTALEELDARWQEAKR